ncbi:amino acid permease [Aristophania vespae]|uniref:Amino acid permease n=1 Tax=Aristophania vespae TaxID=2697033 RepID=A0A6P1NDE9_9PROT|nr:amino acid permease [Aristophania vespae]QHI95493.1 amino acid permease [Aristophania vespae]UMM63067.1 putative amino acid permease YhdG [Aristophania vespae]
MKQPFWRTKPLHSLASKKTSTPELKRVFGPLQLIALGVGVTIGAGLFSLSGVAAGQHAGPAVTLSFIIAAISCGFAGLCYAELAGMIPIAGSAYSYAYVAMGEGAAWIIGWDLFLEYTVNASAVASSWSGYFASLLRDWGIVLDPRFTASTFSPVTLADGSTVQAWFNAPAVFILFLVTGLLMMGVAESSRINAFIVAIKLLIIASVTIICIPHIQGSNFHPFIPANTGTYGEFGFSGVMRAAGMIFFAYIGFDIVSTAAQDARNPQRDIPIGILGSLIVTAIIYAVFSSVLVGVVDYHLLANDPNPVATVLNKIHITWFGVLVKIGIMLGYISVLYGLLLGQSRVALSMSHDGLIPNTFQKLNPLTRTPIISHILTWVTSSILAACLPISILGKMTSIGTLLAFIIVCLGVMVLRIRAPEMPRLFRVPGGSFTVPLLGIICCGAVMVSMDGATWLRLVIWLLIGIVIYFFYGMNNSRLVKKAAAKASHE